MTDEELIAKLRNQLEYYNSGGRFVAADRLEELIHSRDEWRGRAMDRNDECEKWFRKYGNEQVRADALEKERDGLDLDLQTYIEDRDFCKEQWLGTEEKLKKALVALQVFADESIHAGPQHEFVTVKRSDCDIAFALLEKMRNAHTDSLND